MAYNLQPLIQILEQILHPHHHHLNWILDPCKQPLIESLLTKARFLNDVFENPSSLTADAARSLESRIRDAAYHAQNVIESHLPDRLLLKMSSKRITISLPDLLQVIADREFDPIFDELVNLMDGRDMRNGPSSSDLVSSSEDLNPKNIVVGISEDLKQLKEQLIMPHQSTLEIIPIVGMGGIGKTTLAQTLYNDQGVVSNFDTRAWVAISQRYSEKEMLLRLLKCIIGSLSDKMVHQDENDELGLQFYKNLKGRRYLIVLDDMWSHEAWDCLRMFFPNENNRSRILVTTREQSVAKHVAGLENLHHQMKLLNEEESWKLLHQKVFSDGSYSLELEEVGKNIAKDCKGLPLAIHVVGGVVSRLEKTQEAWMQVAKDVGSSVNHDHISNILSLSYNHLPNYLKPCFLYMGAFPEDQCIRASKLIRLWMAEGFLKPILGMNFEETARVYLRELVERNLVLVVQQGTKRKAKSYIMHHLLRDLCISKAREEKFLYIGIDAIKDLKPEEMLRLRLGIHGVHVSDDEFTHIIESQHMPSVVCSILLFAKAGGHHKLSWLDRCSSGLRLLKVLDMLEGNFAVLPQAIERLINLRYLAVRAISYSVPDTITNLCNLQTLILYLESGSLFHLKVKELLNMPQLRHIKFKGDSPLFVLEDGESVNVVNDELQTLSMVEIDESFPRILKAIPNLKKLGINCRSVSPSSSTIDLSSLSQLQILKCSDQPWPGRSVNLIFPRSLKKLMLENCNICIGHLNEIGRLPYLQLFKAKHCYLIGAMGEWKPNEEEFQQLRLLVLQYFMGLKKWIADETHYPRLEHLIIHGCDELEEIPSGLGDIPTLEIVQLSGRATPTALESAMKIQDEQIQYGNDTLQVLIITKSKELERILAALREARAALREATITLQEETKLLSIAGGKVGGARGTLSLVTKIWSWLAMTVKVKVRERVAKAEAKTTEAEAKLAEAAAAMAEAVVEADSAEAMARAIVVEAEAKEDEAMVVSRKTEMEAKTTLAKIAATVAEATAVATVSKATISAAVTEVREAEAMATTVWAEAQAILPEAAEEDGVMARREVRARGSSTRMARALASVAKELETVVKTKAMGAKAIEVEGKATEVEENAALARASAAVAKAKSVGAMMGAKAAKAENNAKLARAKEALAIASTPAEVAEAIAALVIAATEEVGAKEAEAMPEEKETTTEQRDLIYTDPDLLPYTPLHNSAQID